MPSAYDPLLFAGTAPYYARYRSGYPAALFGHLAARLRRDGRGRLLDLGCGTGQLALPLAPHFAEVVGMDPDPDMIAEARAAAEASGVRNVRWVVGSSWDLERLAPELGCFTAVTMGQSFHWMDRDAVLRLLDGMVAAGGAVALVIGATPAAQVEPERLARREAVIREVLARYLGPERRAGAGFYAHPEERHEAVLARSPFSRLERWTHEYERTRTVDEVIGALHASSFAAPHLFGERLGAFDRELRAALGDGAPYREREAVAVLLATRP